MPLTAAEQQELQILQQEESQFQAQAAPQPQETGLSQEQMAKLTPEEQQELSFLLQEDAAEAQTLASLTDTGTQGRALQVGIERGATLGTRPFIAGAAGGLGGFVGGLQAGQPIGEAFGTGVESFKEARGEAIGEEEQLSREFPTTTMVGQLGGGIVTAPFLPAKGLAGAAKAGALIGTGEAIGRAESVGEAAELVAGGALTGAISGAALKGLQKGGAVAGRVIKRASKRIGVDKAFDKVASQTSGVAEKNIKTFRKQTNEVNKIIKEVGGDFQEATNIAKENLANNIRTTRQELGKQIGDEIEKSLPDKIISVKSIIRKMTKVKDGLDEKFNAEAIEQIDDLIRFTGQKGERLSLGELFKLKMELQGRARRGFQKAGTIFPPSGATIRAEKAALIEASKILNESSPAIKAANGKLSQLHTIEDEINKSLLKIGAPEGTFLAAGAGLNQRNVRSLRKLGEITGTDVLGEAEKLSAARAFSTPSLTPGGGAEKTGFFAARLATGAGVGGAISAAVGGDPITGAAIGAALSSPAALKKFIQANKVSKDILTSALRSLNNPSVRSIVSRAAAQGNIDVQRIRKRLKNSIKKAK